MFEDELHRKPKYFIAAFGEKYADKHPVNGGRYPLGRLSNRYSYVEKGDVILLYCAQSYPGYDKEAPAIGVVIDAEIGDEGYTLSYAYLPLDRPVQRSTINDNLEPDEQNYFVNPGANFIFEVKNTSFRKALTGRKINWP